MHIGRTKRTEVGPAWPRRGLLAGLLASAVGLLAVVAVPGSPVPSVSAQAPVGQGFNLNPSDLRFILQQIKIAENHVGHHDGRRTRLVVPCSDPRMTRSRTTGSASRSRGACAPSTAPATTC